MWYVEMQQRKQGNFNGVLLFQPIKATVIILGYGAIFVNLVFVILSLYWFATKKTGIIPRWIVLFNLLVFPLQLYYHFFRF
jgi:hypothetical protein